MTRLDVYVSEHCFGCAEAKRLAALISGRFPSVSVRVVDVGQRPDARPDTVVAVPTFVLDGRIISLGNPNPVDVFLQLESSAVSASRVPSKE